MKFLVFISFVFFTNCLLGQRQAIFEQTVSYDSLIYNYSLNDIISGTTQNFHFPSYDILSDREICIGAIKSKKNKSLNPNFDLECSVKVNKYLFSFNDYKSTTSKKESIKLSITPYAKNIDSLLIFININNVSDYINLTSFKIEEKLSFQNVTTIEVNSSLLRNNKYFKKGDSIFINQIVILAKKKNIKEAGKLLLGEIRIAKTYDLKEKFIGNNIPVKKVKWTNDLIAATQKLSYLNFPISNIDNWGFNSSGNFKLLFPDTLKSNKDTISYIAAYFNEQLDNYPYYDVKGLKKNIYLSEHQYLADTSSSLSAYYLGIKTILNKLYESHMILSFINKNEKNIAPKNQSLRFEELNDKIVISAMFDTAIARVTLCGQQLMAINNIPVYDLILKLESKVAGANHSQRKDKILQSLLILAYEEFKDSLTLSFRPGSTKEHIKLGYADLFKSPNFLPTNFKTNSDFYRIINDRYFYLRPIFQDYFLPKLFTSLENIENTNGVIIDLRDNPGGSYYSIARLFSIFINRPQPFLTCSSNSFTISNKNNECLETWWVKPDKKYNWENKPVCILINSRTACAAEIFISDMKLLRKNVYTIGFSGTPGSAETTKVLSLPETRDLKNVTYVFFNSKTLDGNSNQLSLKGITPETYVPFDSYSDLAPYDDSVLKTAIDILNNVNNP